MKEVLNISLVALLLGASSQASAQAPGEWGEDPGDVQVEVEVVEDPAPERVKVVRAHEEAPDRDDRSIALSLGAGIIGFSEGLLQNMTDIGLAWDLRLTLGTESTLALELAYVGSAQRSDLVIIDSVLVGQGCEALLRLNVGTFDLQPYAIGGIGWTHYKVYRDNQAFNVPLDDDVMTVPVGAGLAFRSHGAMFDVRGTYRMAYDDELARRQIGFVDTPGLDTWSVTGRVGVEF